MMSKTVLFKSFLVASTILSSGAFASNTDKDITDDLYYDPRGSFHRVDPRIGHVSRIAEGAHTHLITNIREKIEAFLHIKRLAQSGNYDDVAADGVELLIAYLADVTLKNVFSNPHTEHDTKLLVKASNTLVDKFT